MEKEAVEAEVAKILRMQKFAATLLLAVVLLFGVGIVLAAILAVLLSPLLGLALLLLMAIGMAGMEWLRRHVAGTQSRTASEVAEILAHGEWQEMVIDFQAVTGWSGYLGILSDPAHLHRRSAVTLQVAKYAVPKQGQYPVTVLTRPGFHTVVIRLNGKHLLGRLLDREELASDNVKMEWLFLAVLVISCLMPAGTGLYQGWQAYRLGHTIELADQSQAWPTTSGVVLDTEVARQELHSGRGRHRYGYVPMVRYRYTVDRVEYTSARVSLADLPGARDKALAVVKQYRSGDEVKVSYLPEAPQTAVLKPGGGKLLQKRQHDLVVLMTVLLILTPILAVILRLVFRWVMGRLMSLEQALSPDSPGSR